MKAGKEPRPHLVALESHLLDRVQAAVLVTDFSGVVVYANPYCEILYGRSTDDLIGENGLGYATDPIRPEVMSEIGEAILNGRNWEGEFRVTREDGSTVDVHAVDSPVFDDEGNVAGVMSVAIDVSAPRVSQEDMKRVLAVAQILRDVGATLVAELDADTVMKTVTGAARKLAGALPPALAGLALALHAGLFLLPTRLGAWTLPDPYPGGRRLLSRNVELEAKDAAVRARFDPQRTLVLAYDNALHAAWFLPSYRVVGLFPLFKNAPDAWVPSARGRRFSYEPGSVGGSRIADAFSMMGYPTSSATRAASATLQTGPSLPGMVGNPASHRMRLARDLSPRSSMLVGSGPMNTRSLSRQARANAVFSERNPYPGWTASHCRILAAATTLGMDR
jgi:PAS domain S-box-containing protein